MSNQFSGTGAPVTAFQPATDSITHAAENGSGANATTNVPVPADGATQGNLTGTVDPDGVKAGHD